MDAKTSIVAAALAGIVMIVAMKIPLPGIDIGAAAAQMSASSGAMSRLSIFAIGLTPLYTALILTEIGRLFLARRGDPRSPPGRIETGIVGVIALAVTVLQGYGVVQAMRSAGLLDQDFVIPAVATYMGVTAVLIFLSLHIRLAGFRTGFWALWLVPILLTLPTEFAYAIDLTRTGVIPGMSWLVFAAYVLLSIAAIVTMAALWKSAWSENADAHGATGVEARGILIWPPVLASSIATYFLTFIAIVAPDLFNVFDTVVLQGAVLVIAALLIPVFVTAYWRQSAAMLRGGAPRALIVAVIACVQILLLVAGSVLNLLRVMPVGIGYTAFLALTLVAISLFSARAGRFAATADAVNP